MVKRRRRVLSSLTNDLIVKILSRSMPELPEMVKRRRVSSSLTNDLIVEILSRSLPGVCRFNCCVHDLGDLVAHPVHCVQLPQTWAGFFTMHDGETWLVPHFTNVSGKSTNSLPLCKYSPIWDITDSHYFDFVCNLTTKEWVALPNSNLVHKRWASCLGFNPAVPSYFYAYEIFKDYGVPRLLSMQPPLVSGVEVYYSETGERVCNEDND